MSLFQNQNRKAEILEIKSKVMYPYFIVRLWEDNKHIEDREMITGQVVHSYSYAEDCAKNWIYRVF
jgi:hypothetical protein